MGGAVWDWQRENRKAAYMDFLYELDGRGDKGHPMHGLYTGLGEARAAALLDHDREVVIRGQQA